MQWKVETAGDNYILKALGGGVGPFPAIGAPAGPAPKHVYAFIAPGSDKNIVEWRITNVLDTDRNPGWM